MKGVVRIMKLDFNNISEEDYIALKKSIKRKKYMIFLLAFFTLGINIFAWFVYSSQANFSIDANISSWDVKFKYSDEEFNSITINIDNMLPGMETVNKTVEVTNLSDVAAAFSYSIKEVRMFGEKVNVSSSELEQYIVDNYPFKLNFSSSKDSLDVSDMLTFNIGISWDYDSTSDLYYPVKNVYEFDSGITYYTLENGVYSEYYGVTNANFNSKKDSFYISKDDADSYLGYKCSEYEKSSGKSCLSFDLVLSVEQKK
jgi:hypothetical protein